MRILSVWSTIGSVLLFIVALSLLIVIHELGHFIAAKSFKVYCSDFSIGFGPKFVKIKRKKGETTFNMGIIPLGGYVSMYGEGVELPDGKTIPKSRSLNGINRWKRAVIMAAGIFMNFVLAYIIFFISASCFPQYKYYINAPIVTNNQQYTEQRKVVDATTNEIFEFQADDRIAMGQFSVTVDGKEYIFDNLLTVKTDRTDISKNDYEPTYIKNTVDGKDYYYSVGLVFNTPKSTEDLANGASIYEASKYDVGTVKYATLNEKNEKVFVTYPYEIYLPTIKDGTVSRYKFDENTNFTSKINVYRTISDEKDPTKKSLEFHDVNLTLKGTKENTIEPLYIGCNFDKYWNGWDSFRVAGIQWVDSTGAVANALGGLFVGKNWDQVGGPLAIFNQSSLILNEFPFSQYLNVWAIISVNLALFNLLPFPGLDGWQLLVTGIEGTVNLFTRAKYRTTYEEGKDLKKKKSKKGSKDVLETSEVGEEIQVSTSKRYKKDLLKQLSILNENINDVEKNYFYKFNKKYDQNALSNTFSDPQMIEEYKANEEYKYFADHSKAVQEYDEYVLLNNLNEVKPYKEWGIPETVKNIVSYIGLGLLMLLAVAVFVLDIIKMVK